MLPAAVFMQCIVDAQGPQVFGNAGLSVFTAGLPDEAQFLPPGLHSLTQFLFGLGKVKGFVEPLGHKQTVKRNQRFQFPDAVPVDQPQGGCFFFPLGLFYCFYLLINGSGDLLTLGLHLPDALLKILQRVSVKPLGSGQSSGQLLIPLVDGSTVGLGILDGFRCVHTACIGGQKFVKVLLHLIFVPVHGRDHRALYSDSQFIRHRSVPPLLAPGRGQGSNHRAAPWAGRNGQGPDSTSHSSLSPPS